MLLFRSISTLSLLTYCAIALGNGVYSSVEAIDSTKHKRKKVVNKTTYSTKKLKSESFDKRFIAAPLDILRGKVAGVNIAHSGAERLAMLNSVRVRGTTSVTAGNDPFGDYRWCFERSFVSFNHLPRRYCLVHDIEKRLRNSHLWFKRCIGCDLSNNQKGCSRKV